MGPDPVSAIDRLAAQLEAAVEEAGGFFAECEEGESERYRSGSQHDALSRKARELAERFNSILVRVATLVRESPMFGDPDLRAIQMAVRRVNASLRLRLYEEWNQEVIHDEDRILGLRQAGFSEERRLFPSEAFAELKDAVDQVQRRIGVLRAQAEAEKAGEAAPAWRVPNRRTDGMRIRPGTAFIMMMMDPGNPELEDVKRTIQETFARFNIRAVRADDIEHSGEITNRILEEIKSAEFLIADLTGERPSVYYEIGFAHALGKRPILYRRAGTRLHFDLAVHNCPEYVNLTDLQAKLTKRLRAITGND
ncbi:MAG: hypothetical protein QME92_05850 [Bacillota bacterium]|nr:hypothetical protein [Bacillota bacterium]